MNHGVGSLFESVALQSSDHSRSVKYRARSAWFDDIDIEENGAPTITHMIFLAYGIGFLSQNLDNWKIICIFAKYIMLSI